MILGCGLVGKLIAKDLGKGNYFQVSVADIDQKKINKITKDLNIKGIKENLSDSGKIKK